MAYKINIKEEDGSEEKYVLSTEKELSEFIDTLKVSMIDSWFTSVSIQLMAVKD